MIGIEGFEDPEDLIRKALAISDATKRQEALKRIAEFLVNSESHMIALEALTDFDAIEDKEFFILGIFEFLVDSDYTDATQFLGNISAGDLNPRIVKSVVSSLAAVNPAVAADWVGEYILNSSDLIANSTEIVVSLIHQWAITDPAGAHAHGSPGLRGRKA
jgi:hypothetical protein